jgi:hypothetical protein
MLLLPSAFQDPPEASGWILTAARDFGTTANFIRDARKLDQSSVDHIGLLVGALVTYARPFRERADDATRRAARRQRCLLDLATDLGVDLALHAAVLRMRDRLVAQAAVPTIHAIDRTPEIPSLRVRVFEFPNHTIAELAVKMDFEQVISLTKSMQLACVFLLAEVNCVPR